MKESRLKQDCSRALYEVHEIIMRADSRSLRKLRDDLKADKTHGWIDTLAAPMLLTLIKDIQQARKRRAPWTRKPPYNGTPSPVPQNKPKREEARRLCTFGGPNQFLFQVLSFGKERTPVWEYGLSEKEAREKAKHWLKRGEKLGTTLEAYGVTVDAQSLATQEKP